MVVVLLSLIHLYIRLLVLILIGLSSWVCCSWLWSSLTLWSWLVCPGLPCCCSTPGPSVPLGPCPLGRDIPDPSDPFHPTLILFFLVLFFLIYLFLVPFGICNPGPQGLGYPGPGSSCPGPPDTDRPSPPGGLPPGIYSPTGHHPPVTGSTPSFPNSPPQCF